VIKVARKHIIAAIEYANKPIKYDKYSITAHAFQDLITDKFGWRIDVTPKSK